MRDKKGFLLAEETLKIIVAVICIGFLVYFLTSLYLSNVNDEKKQHAEATLDRIFDISKNKENTIEQISEVTPVGWMIFSFTGNEKPNICVGQSCLCICDDTWIANQLKECDEEGVCIEIKNLGIFEEIKIEKSPFILEITKQPEVIIRKK